MLKKQKFSYKETKNGNQAPNSTEILRALESAHPGQAVEIQEINWSNLTVTYDVQPRQVVEAEALAAVQLEDAGEVEEVA